jgi:hypothetical protein
MTLNAILKCNGTEITEHGRKLSLSYRMPFNDIELAAGNLRRYRKPTMPSLTVNWTYLPDKSTRTVDLREGRNFLFTLSTTRALVNVLIQEEREGEWTPYTCRIVVYSESLIRTDFESQCKYYNVNMQLEVVR